MVKEIKGKQSMREHEGGVKVEDNKCTKTNCGNNECDKCNIGKTANQEDDCKYF